MSQMLLKKLSFSILLVMLVELSFLCNEAMANNTSYITLSNQIARDQQLGIVANNAANANTIGFEQDQILLRKVDYKQTSRRKNSFVFSETTYKNGIPGGLKHTNVPTDLAIGGSGYFKILTNRGPRYTLNGSMKINNQNILVTSEGFPFASENNAQIEIPDDFQSIDITEDGTIFVDDEEVGVIGVFDFANNDQLIKEGHSLYSAKAQEIIPDNYVVISGALRDSNVNSTLVMAKLVELQRSAQATNNIMSDVTDLERTAVNKLVSK